MVIGEGVFASNLEDPAIGPFSIFKCSVFINVREFSYTQHTYEVLAMVVQIFVKNRKTGGTDEVPSIVVTETERLEKQTKCLP